MTTREAKAGPQTRYSYDLYLAVAVSVAIAVVFEQSR